MIVVGPTAGVMDCQARPLSRVAVLIIRHLRIEFKNY
jgi:hypothetical protein